jgi:hypothetical protein
MEILEILISRFEKEDNAKWCPQFIQMRISSSRFDKETTQVSSQSSQPSITPTVRVAYPVNGVKDATLVVHVFVSDHVLFNLVDGDVQISPCCSMVESADLVLEHFL